MDDPSHRDRRGPAVPWRRGFAVGVVVWFVGFVLAFLATPLVGGPVPIDDAPFAGPILAYVGFHLWFVLSTGDLVLGYGPGLVLASIPFAVLLAGGTAVATGRAGGGYGADAVAGASIAVGYAFATLLAYAVVVVLVETGVSPLTPSFGSGPGVAVVLAVNGVVQPAVAGAVGALLS